jgi:hypothetical protein
VAERAVLPDIGNVLTRLDLGNGDIKIPDLNINALNILKSTRALSAKNVNTSDKAVIDSMDSSVREDLVSMLSRNLVHSVG